MKQLRSFLPTVSITDLGLDDEWILNILGLYAPNNLTQGFALDEPGCHRNSIDDDEDNPTISVNDQSVECTESNLESCHDRTIIATADIHNYNPNKSRSDDEEQASPEQLKANLERFEELRTQSVEHVDQSDFELSTRSEPAMPSPSVVRRRKKNSGSETWQSRRGTKVLGHKWITPPPRSNSFSAPERPTCEAAKDATATLAASLPSMLEAEERMSCIMGAASIPIDIPGQRVSDATMAVDSGVCCESLSNMTDEASSRNSTENTNNCRYKYDEGLSTCNVSIMVTPPPQEPTTEEIDEEQLAKRRNDPYVAAFLERFRTAYYSLRVVLQESVPTAKFQWLCKCLKEVNDVAEKQAQLIFCK